MTSPRERAQLQAQLRQQQEALVRDLLPVLDALDRAETHWRQVLAEQRAVAAPTSAAPGLWRRLRRLLNAREAQPATADPTVAAGTSAEGAAALAQSAGEGISLIRASLLETLRSHGLEGFETVGQPFDPERMLALGQRPGSPGAAPGEVVEEALRGYLWHQSLLREAQVLVAGPSAGSA